MTPLVPPAPSLGSNLRVYRDIDADLAYLADRRIVIVGYGNQGRAQALNLRDSGIAVTIAGIGDASIDRARADGFATIAVKGCAKVADVLMLLIPDEVQRQVYDQDLAADLGPGKLLCFGHGYNFHFGAIVPPPFVDVVLLAPRMIGAVVRSSFEAGKGAPAYVAVGQDGSGRARDILLALAKGIGATRAGAIELSFEQETVIDLFIEQTLMPIFTRSMTWAFDVLTEAGIDPGVVTLEMYGSGETAEVFQACATLGFWEQLRLHSRTAQFGELSNKDLVLPPAVRDTMRNTLDRIRSGAFAKEWAEDAEAGFPRYNALIAETRVHPINQAEKAIAKLVDFGATFAGA
ncbi:MAG: ketol-acid reductoisomerase [Gemmatimonadales bacterium]